MNPGGKTSEQRQREIANAERATKLRERMLVALEKQLDEALEAEDVKIDAAAVGAIQSDNLRLLKDTEDRGFGSPTAKIEGPGPNGEHTVNDMTTLELARQIAFTLTKAAKDKT